MIPTPIEPRDMAEELLEATPVVEEKSDDGWDCGNADCYKYRHCWACEEWFGCKRKPLGNCFRCDMKDCPLVVDDCASCKLPGV